MYQTQHTNTARTAMSQVPRSLPIAAANCPRAHGTRVDPGEHDGGVRQAQSHTRTPPREGQRTLVGQLGSRARHVLGLLHAEFHRDLELAPRAQLGGHLEQHAHADEGHACGVTRALHGRPARHTRHAADWPRLAGAWSSLRRALVLVKSPWRHSGRAWCGPTLVFDMGTDRAAPSERGR